MSRQTRDVTETEFAILNVLWDRGPSTVRGIVEVVYGRHTHSLHTSVKSLLERLADLPTKTLSPASGAGAPISSRPPWPEKSLSPNSSNCLPTVILAAH
jgi:hypothetical protein